MCILYLYRKITKGAFCMNFQKFTRKSIEAVNSAQSLASEYGNSEITELHMLLALLEQQDGIIGGLAAKLTPQSASLKSEILSLIKKLPKVSGGDVYVAQDLNAALNEAEKQAEYEEQLKMLFLLKGKNNVTKKVTDFVTFLLLLFTDNSTQHAHLKPSASFPVLSHLKMLMLVGHYSQQLQLHSQSSLLCSFKACCASGLLIWLEFLLRRLDICVILVSYMQA